MMAHFRNKKVYNLNESKKKYTRSLLCICIILFSHGILLPVINKTGLLIFTKINPFI